MKVGIRHIPLLLNLLLEHIVACGDGANTEHHNKCEVLKLDDDTWTDIDAYPFSNVYYKFTVLFSTDGFYFFGGKEDKIDYERRGSVSRLDSKTFDWEYLGQLNQQRKKLSAIEINGEFLIIGGESDKGDELKSEKCILDNTGNVTYVTCFSQEPILPNHKDSSALFRVNADYCHFE